MEYKRVNTNGDQLWYKDANRTILHREDGPTIERADGTKEWFLNSKRHRTDGPAFEFSDGSKSWWLTNIKYLDPKQYQKDAGLSDEDMTMILLRYDWYNSIILHE